MRRFVSACCVLLLAACGGGEAADDAAVIDEMPSVTLADFAGTWHITSTLDGSDPVESQLSGSETGMDWVITLADRDPIPAEVSIVGDSLVSQTGSFESVIRAGVMVSVRTASVLHDGMLSGNITAVYATDAGEEVVHGTTTGTRVEVQ